MSELSDSYDPDEIEPKWRRDWFERSVYEYTDSGAPDYVVDTPPPYPTGNFHIGNALGWCYQDFAARYKRLQGFDVSFPQGWDCHGLPTEVKVEEKHGIDRTEVSRQEFREMCIEHTEEQIAAMKDTMRDLGFSQDWSQEYQTMDPEYWGLTQRSFVEMADDGYVYRDEHPVNWCPRCNTAIADAEVENEDRQGTLYYLTFPGVDGEDIEIATTRPELLAACVGIAVDPDDERYAGRAGDTFEVPLFGQEVTLFADEDVDADFGTGAVMVCTFGDKQDVEWWAEHGLDLRPVFTEDGHLSALADDYAGLSIAEAKEEIAADLEAEGYLNDSEPIEQSVGVCWRCDTAIEILSKEQWFIEVDQESILAKARQVEWIPEHMYTRFEEWTESMEWDWVISRQREFATSIPVWYCDDCDHVHVASVEELPVDPTEEGPAVDACPKCGADDWEGETDVMDTWMDSSISALYANGWPDEEFEPTQLREQGHDIIRTWAFYTVLRTDALVDEIPWEDALINGMVMGDDGNKMSKSKGNFVQPEEVLAEYSADAFRQAIALGGQPGTDIQFQWKEVKSASRFITKIWNICRFTFSHLEAGTPGIEDPEYREADRWILSKADRVAATVADAMDEYRFDEALRTIRDFVWHDFADDYVELVKGRLYDGTPEEREAAQHALYVTVSASLRMLAPFVPFVAEELWDNLPGAEGSVHLAEWPELGMVDETAEQAGELVADVASAVRGWKSDRGMPLNAELAEVEVYPDEELARQPETRDLENTINATVTIEEGEPPAELEPTAIEPDQAAIGQEFRDRTGPILGALEDASPAEVKRQLDEAGEVELDLGGEVVVVDADALSVTEEYDVESGVDAEVVESERAILLIYE